MKTWGVRELTKKIYMSVWRTFNEFFIRLDNKPDMWEECIILFAGYLIDQRKQSQTVRSYVSTIKCILRFDSVLVNEDKILLNSIVRAYKLNFDRFRTRLPIQKNLLNLIVQATELYFEQKGQPYLSTLYTTLFSVAYYGLFRMGELARGEHPVKVCDVQLAENKPKWQFILRTSKTHGTYMKSQIIKLSRTGDISHSLCCPYSLLICYSSIRPHYALRTEPYFIFSDRSLVTMTQARSTLRLILASKNIDERLYGGHSFRLGHSLDLYDLGVPISAIHKLGCWRSSAIYTYLK